MSEHVGLVEDFEGFELIEQKGSTGFKKAFGISKKTKSWTAINKALDKQMNKLESSVRLLESIGAPEAEKATEEFNELNEVWTEAISGKKKDVDSLKECAFGCMEQLQRNTIAAKKTPLKVTIGNPNTDVNVFWTDIPGFEDMAPKDREKAAKKVGEKILRGNALVDAIATPSHEAPPLPTGRQQKRQAVTDIVWALKTQAQEKVGPYEKGALTTPGGEELRKFFDSCGEDIYPRKSTHLGDQQKKKGQSPRGMDFYDGMDTLAGNGDGDGLLPMGMNTVLLQMVEDTKGNKRMYIKMETASAYGSAGATNKNDEDPIPGGGRNDKVAVTELISHGANIFRNTDQHKDLDSHRETTPKGIYELCVAIIKLFEHKTAKAELKLALGKGKEKLRVNVFIAKLEYWLKHVELSEEAETAVAQLYSKIEDIYGEDVDISLQAGGEVAL